MIGPPVYGPWHPWFAWRPVRTDWYGWRWLRIVERRGWRGAGYYGWDYRPAKEQA